MKSRALIMALLILATLPLVLCSCKGKARTPEATQAEDIEIAVGQDEMMITEPAQTVATETIPPTAAAPMTVQKSAIRSSQTDRNRDIQKALANAGFYNAAIDGKIGPKTRSAIEEFQKAKTLKADGKVGPRTWAELEKYLNR